MTTPESIADSPAGAALRLIDLRGQELEPARLRAALPRLAGQDAADAEASARSTIAAVRERGWPAVRELAERFDGVQQEQPKVPREALREALAGLPAPVRAGLEESIRRARLVAAAQRPGPVSTEVGPGATVTLRWEPVRRVGLYIPGGRAVYPSSVVMNAVPAQAAGVGSLVLCSPPQREHGGLPHPSILAAAELLGITEVYAIGGSQAIAAMAYGLEPAAEFAGLEPVEVISGPGNNFVAAAKRLVNGQVGIDAEAGATEIAVLADAAAPAGFIAADLISQAEHDPQAAAVLVTDSPELIVKVRAQLDDQIAATQHRQRVLTALSGPQSAILLVDSLAAGVEVVNAYAAEHLEVLTRDAATDARQVHSAGAIFLGPSAPVSLGDYCAGSNHVLPTGGTAAFASGLSVFTFLKALQVVDYDADALAGVAEHIVALAQAENLPAHGDAVSIRVAGVRANHNI
ncbi:histidinol dehydrogenase [Acaricomes phytoseiuli]|uniref:histidinol dehydrogenase n=1 Tax=Acaricomes phytoseiuli TaxID=291968 RepID=UPI002221C016|nr:histidinol dehydrogenase [Acaricomes phytoseiuli]MCW1249564.1 histidinol dehydrogenase [Acaricomes phytoseiuli]